MHETDGQLLERFARSKEQSAFAGLVERHGPMVMGVCRRVLHDEHDAEDVFQATFLVLARRAGAIRKWDSVGSWLYGVAVRLAMKLKSGAGARREREKEAATMPGSERLGGDLLNAVIWKELRPVLDEELSQLPEKYRSPLVLCYLEGRTHDEAAEELHWPKGSISRRMEKAKHLLRVRLSRRGVTLSSGMIFAAVAANAQAAVSTTLVTCTIQAATLVAAGKAAAAGVISAQAAALSEGVLQTMFMAKLKVAAMLMLAVGIIGTGAGAITYNALADDNTGSSVAQTGGGPGSGPGTAGAPGKPGTTTADNPGPVGRPSANPPGRSGSGGGSGDARSAATSREVRQKLMRRTDALRNGIDNGTPLEEALSFIGNSTDLQFNIDEAAWNRHSVRASDLAKKPVELAKMNSIPLAVALQQLLSTLDPLGDGGIRATFVVRGNHVVIVPSDRVLAQPLGGEGNEIPISEALREPIHISVDDKPLVEALKELAENTGANIVLDNRLKEKAKVPVSVTLQHVPLETAVRLMADMAEVKTIALDNVLYVTTKENAEKFMAEHRERLGLPPSQYGSGMGGILGGSFGGMPGVHPGSGMPGGYPSGAGIGGGPGAMPPGGGGGISGLPSGPGAPGGGIGGPPQAPGGNVPKPPQN